MSDGRYIQCTYCGTRDQITCTVNLPVEPGDGAPTFDRNAWDFQIQHWDCDACGQTAYRYDELCFIGWDGITSGEIEAQLS